MIRAIMLDSGPLGRLTHADYSRNRESRVWLAALLDRNVSIFLPEIADYEVRRNLIVEGLTGSLANLDALPSLVTYVPLTTADMRKPPSCGPNHARPVAASATPRSSTPMSSSPPRRSALERPSPPTTSATSPNLLKPAFGQTSNHDLNAPLHRGPRPHRAMPRRVTPAAGSGPRASG